MQGQTLSGARVEKTRTPGIYRDHKDHCTGSGRCDCPWMVQIGYRGADGARRQVKKRCATEREAREWKASFDSGQRKPTARRFFDDYAREWITTYRGRTRHGIDEGTRASYARSLELHATPYFRHTPLRDIDRDRVDGFVTTLYDKGLKPATVQRHLAPVQALLATAAERGHITSNPATSLRIRQKAGQGVKEDERRMDLSRVELLALLDALPEGSRERDLFELIAWTGLRIGEALGVRPEDFTFGAAPSLRVERQCTPTGEIKHTLKTPNSRRTVEIDAGLARRLWPRAQTAPAGGYLFATSSGRPMLPRDVRLRFERAARTVGIKTSPHCLRHIHGSMLLDAGNSVAQVADRLGDTVETISKTYLHKLRGTSANLDFCGQREAELAEAV
jgi:integrase